MAISAETQAALDLALANLSVQLGLPADAELDVSKLTQVDLSGSGVFDKLLATCALAAQVEFDTDRIRGTDYASFYLGIVQTALQNSTQFLLAWDKAAIEKANLLAQLQVSLKQIDLVNAQIADAEAGVRVKEQQILESEANVRINTEQSDNDTALKEQQTNLTKSQTSLYTQKTITEMAETNTTMPSGIDAGSDLSTVVPLVPVKIAGAKGANRDVALEQRAGYMRKAQNDLIKVATGHVDMLVSSGAATDVGDYTSELLELLQTGSSTGNFGADSLLAIAVTDVAQLNPNDADSQD